MKGGLTSEQRLIIDEARRCIGVGFGPKKRRHVIVSGREMLDLNGNY